MPNAFSRNGKVQSHTNNFSVSDEQYYDMDYILNRFPLRNPGRNKPIQFSGTEIHLFTEEVAQNEVQQIMIEKRMRQFFDKENHWYNFDIVSPKNVILDYSDYGLVVRY